ncbi:MAG: DUF1015 domain-containing protein [Anaerolineae bacterium]
MVMSPPIGFQIPAVLLPRPGIDLHRWAVIACDQFTSEPEYWREVEALVGDAPSTYHLTLPEIYLGTEEEARRGRAIQETMRAYLEQGLFVEHEGLILVERTAAGRTRHGIMLALDLEHYDYSKGSTSLIRASEGTILERIPPRVRIRAGAALELPHIVVLIDDPEHTVIAPLARARDALSRLYDFELMLGSGHLTGYAVDDPDLTQQTMDALARLARPDVFAARYGLSADVPPLLFAVGDGNHSLATAKAIWEQIKPQVGMDHPARYALVEVENIHDPGLIFEPIHRVLFGARDDTIAALLDHFADRCRLVPCANARAMMDLVEREERPEHTFGIITADGFTVAYVADPPSNLPVGTLQSFLDDWGKAGGYGKIDYVHGSDVVERLGKQKGNIGFYVPTIAKSAFFKTIILDGVLPRKTFSMGEAREKRFYMEARRIV